MALSTDMSPLPNTSLSGATEESALPDPQRKAIAALRERFGDLQNLQPMVGGDGAWVAHSPKACLWFAIETDGHVHT
jgi:hypothetical protein